MLSKRNVFYKIFSWNGLPNFDPLYKGSPASNGPLFVSPLCDRYGQVKLYMYGNTKPAFTTEPLNGCLRNLVGIKCSWPGTCIKMFWLYLPRGWSRARQNRSRGPLLKKTSSSDWKATATNWMHSNDLEACVMKCCCFWFHSVVKFFDPWI